MREAGWNQVAADWEIFRALGTVYAARVSGRVVATAATLPYGEFAWISMVLVAGEQRRNLGTQLLKRCIADLREQGRVPVLDATPAGRPLYRALGFEETWGFHRLARPVAMPAPGNTVAAGGTIVRPIADADWAALCAYDAAAFGADRSALLQRLRGRLPAAELVAERTAAWLAFCSAATGEPRRRSARWLPRTMTLRRRCWRARCPPSTARSMSTSPTARPPFAHGFAIRLYRAAPAHPHAARPRNGLRRSVAHLRRGRTGVRLKRKGRSRLRPARAVLKSAQYSFGGLIGGILMVLSRNSLV